MKIILVVFSFFLFYSILLFCILKYRKELKNNDKSQEIMSEIVSNDLFCDIEEVFDNLEKNNFDFKMMANCLL